MPLLLWTPEPAEFGFGFFWSFVSILLVTPQDLRVPLAFGRNGAPLE